MWGDYHLREVALFVKRLAEGGPYLSFFGVQPAGIVPISSSDRGQ
jgi:hypothetical protein